MKIYPRQLGIHALLIAFAFLTLVPFGFMLNNVFRSNSEFYHSFFSLPDTFRQAGALVLGAMTGDGEEVTVRTAGGGEMTANRGEAIRRVLDDGLNGPRRAWKVVRPYMLNTLVVSGVSALGVAVLGSLTAYILARYRFRGNKLVFILILSTMMFPAVLTLVPSFLLVKQLGLLNTYWAMILPYIAGGQVFAIFVFKSFFEGLPEEVFESARIDGAGHRSIYWHIVMPLSRPAVSVVVIMNVLGTWNEFLWPFITNTEGKHHVIASGLYTIAHSSHAANMSTMFAAYAISSVPLLILFIYATRPFIRGMTSGALKA